MLVPIVAMAWTGNTVQHLMHSDQHQSACQLNDKTNESTFICPSCLKIGLIPLYKPDGSYLIPFKCVHCHLQYYRPLKVIIVKYLIDVVIRANRCRMRYEIPEFDWSLICEETDVWQRNFDCDKITMVVIQGDQTIEIAINIFSNLSYIG